MGCYSLQYIYIYIYSRICDGHIIVSLDLFSTVYLCKDVLAKLSSWMIRSRMLLRKILLFQTFCLRTSGTHLIELLFTLLYNYSYEKHLYCQENRHYLFTEKFRSRILLWVFLWNLDLSDVPNQYCARDSCNQDAQDVWHTPVKTVMASIFGPRKQD